MKGKATKIRSKPPAKMGMACAFCQKRKRKCDGLKPTCSICLKYNKNGKCEYSNDKRKNKFDSTYVDYLEMKVDLLQQLADELIRGDETHRDSDGRSKAERVDCELVKERRREIYGVGQDEGNRKSMKGERSSGKKNAEKLLKDLTNEVAIDEFISTKWRVRRDVGGNTEFYGPVSGRQQVLENNEVRHGREGRFNSNDFLSGRDEYRIDEIIESIETSKEFKDSLIDEFSLNFGKFFYISELLLSEIKTWDFPNNDISKQLLLFAIFTYGTVFKPVHRKLSSFFLKEAHSIVLKAGKEVNELYIHATLIISCYQLGIGQDSNPWVFDAMASSMTQFLRLDRSDEKSASTASNALFWSVILQDRIITSVFGRGCRIQIFRITSPFFKPVIQDRNNPLYLTELSFANHSKLWFIYDRYISQIYSFRADHLHNSHKLTLMNQGIESLEKFQKSLPIDLKLTDETQDPRVLILQLSYSVIKLLLHRAYLKQIPLKVIQIIIVNCERSSNIIDRLAQSNITSIPYFISYLILTCATFDLFLLTNKDESIKANSSIRLKIYINALNKFGNYWRRCHKDIKVLDQLASSWGLDVPFLKKASLDITTMEASSSESNVIDQGDGINYDIFFNQFNEKG